MMNVEEYADLKRLLVELDPDELLETLRIDSELLLEMVENWDPLLIEDAGERLGRGSDAESERTSIRAKGKDKRATIKG